MRSSSITARLSTFVRACFVDVAGCDVYLVLSVDLTDSTRRFYTRTVCNTLYLSCVTVHGCISVHLSVVGFLCRGEELDPFVPTRNRPTIPHQRRSFIDNEQAEVDLLVGGNTLRISNTSPKRQQEEYFQLLHSRDRIVLYK